MSKKVTSKLQFDLATRRKIFMRDHGQCIFCEAGFPVPEEETFGRDIKDIMHYIPRSQMGLGIEKNGAVGCRYHHMKLDNGNDSLLRQAMLETFRDHLRKHYGELDRKELTFSKWEGGTKRRSD